MKHLMSVSTKPAAAHTALSRCSFIRRIIFPQMTQWLPADEGTQLRFEFETEIARLEAA